MIRTFAISLMLTVSLFAAACSSGAAGSDVASLDTDFEALLSTEAGAIPGEGDVLAFTACLRDEGLEVEDPAVDSEGNLVAPTPHALAGRTLDMGAVHSAFDVCKDHLDNVAFGMSTEDQSEREDELLAFAVCMRENGYDMPDPDFSNGGHTGDGPFGDAIDTDNPLFVAAAPSCQDIIGG
jgi:hypothetical protein